MLLHLLLLQIVKKHKEKEIVQKGIAKKGVTPLNEGTPFLKQFIICTQLPLCGGFDFWNFRLKFRNFV